MKPFLTAEWRKLAMANYAVDPKLLKDHVPHLTQLDLHKGVCYVSLVGFMFLNTRVKGIRVPFHINFEEINLRYYIHHQDGNENKRGVGFIKEIVPKPALSFIANLLYKEKYVTLPTVHQWDETPLGLNVQYKWKTNSWNSLSVNALPAAHPIDVGSDEEFILEHYWGYTKADDKTTFEYKVEHPRWNVYPVNDFGIDVDFGGLYGKEFGFLKTEKPASVFLSEGSEIAVYPKTTLRYAKAAAQQVTSL
jgi:uncharacterized protein